MKKIDSTINPFLQTSEEILEELFVGKVDDLSNLFKVCSNSGISLFAYMMIQVNQLGDDRFSLTVNQSERLGGSKSLRQRGVAELEQYGVIRSNRVFFWINPFMVRIPNLYKNNKHWFRDNHPGLYLKYQTKFI